MSNEQLWLSVGLVGQAFFSMRFVVQWLASEKRRESVIPVSFWSFSIGGGAGIRRAPKKRERAQPPAASQDS
jgi:lipid-A-disaccharide synthase-like uncharacterized protein